MFMTIEPVAWLTSRFLFNTDAATELEKLGILYQSPNFLIVNKHHDLLINSNGGDQVTVEKQLKFYFPHLVDVRLTHGFHFCHRLDFATSGLLCLALSKAASRSCQEAFFERRVQKYYLALLHGHVDGTVVVMDKAVGSDTRPKFSHCMCADDKEYCSKPRKALTLLLVLQHGLLDGVLPSTKVLLKPITGRRHQLRVHCHELKHGVVGDLTYGEGKDGLALRMFLHSYRLLLPTSIETVDVRTLDPFCLPQTNWHPVKTIFNLDSEVFSRFPNVQFKE